MKTCTRCKVAKPETEFFRDNRRPGGRMSRCKTCKNSLHRDYVKSRPGYDALRYRDNRDHERERHLVRKYGVTLEVYAEMLSTQGGACAVCRRPEPEGRGLDVDHDHLTGKVRGLLCTSCNRMLGHAHDSADRLQRGSQYLQNASVEGRR